MPNYDEITKSAYREMELHLISSMKRNLGLHIAEEIKTGKEYPQWQAIKLRELRKYQKENSDIIKRSVGSFPKDVANQLENELKQGAVQEQHRYNIAKGVTMNTAMDESFFKLNRNKLAALQKSVNNDLSNANNAVLRMMNDTYRSTIYKYELFLADGVYTPTQAYDAAVKDFLERGLNCIEYRDGRRVNIADYTDMAIKTANKRAQLMGEGSFRKSIGNPLIIMSAHNTSCKLCKPFQNKVLIDDVYSGGTQEDGDYMLLSEAMERGLYHPRCKHGCGTYYPEIEHINQYETPENKLNDYGDKLINAAHIDNMIQRYKRLVAGSVDKNNIEKYQNQLKLWEQEREKIAVAQSFGVDFEPFNESATFKVDIPIVDAENNRVISDACKEVARLGGETKKEHLALVDLVKKKIVYQEIGDDYSVGSSEMYEFMNNNPSKYAFVHNHPGKEGFSLSDMNSFFGCKYFDVFIASCHNGKIHVVYNKKTLHKGSAIGQALELDIQDLQSELKSGKISRIEFQKRAERQRVAYLRDTFCDYMEVDTR